MRLRHPSDIHPRGTTRLDQLSLPTVVLFYVKVALFNVLLSFALLEGGLATILALPGLHAFLPQPALTFLRVLYKQGAMRLIPPECARYDPQLTYSLQPGTCTFSGHEFSHTLRINSQGLRDDEESLHAPDIIVLGDSHAMGWGVDQEDTFPHVIERESGLKVLNAAIASYGTVRELRLLDRLDTTRLTYLIIQYCDNDYLENRAFSQNNNDLRITPADEYQRLVERYRREQPYYPGKYTVVSVRKAAEVWKARRDRRSLGGQGRQRDIDYFLNALANAGRTNLRNVRIIVFESKDGYGQNDARFVTTLKDTLASPAPKFASRIIPIDLSAELNANYYPLDGHITQRGHRLIANALLHLIRQGTLEGRAGGVEDKTLRQ